jgi:hypothetical protein
MNAIRTLAATVLAIATVVGVAPTPALAQTVYASGLLGPRGLRFGPDGALYVAEAGTGGTNSSGSACPQVVPPIGPYTGGNTARISRIASDGTRTTVAQGFPSTQGATGAQIGVADVAFIGTQMYALVGGGGCSHGNPTSPSGIAWVNPATGEWKLLVNIGNFLKVHPAAYESADDFEPDGTLYSMIALNGVLYTVEPNHGQVFSFNPANGQLHQVIDISASEGHIVPTAITSWNGAFYVGNLNLFPIDPQWARILTIATTDGDTVAAPGFDIPKGGWHIVNSKAGFTTVVAVDFGPDGLLYVLELSDAAGMPTGGAGKVVRVRNSGVIEDVVTGLVVPTGMTFGPDGRLYISNFGAAGPGAGQILQVDVPPAT